MDFQKIWPVMLGALAAIVLWNLALKKVVQPDSFEMEDYA